MRETIKIIFISAVQPLGRGKKNVNKKIIKKVFFFWYGGCCGGTIGRIGMVVRLATIIDDGRSVVVAPSFRIYWDFNLRPPEYGVR